MTMPAALPLSAFIRRLIWQCVLPLVLLAGFLAVDHIRTVEAERDLEASNLVKTLAASIDQYLDARIGALQMLALSPLADDGPGWEGLYREAQGFVRSFGSHVVFVDRDLRMRFATRVPFGAPLPMLPRPQGHAAAPAALQTGRPAVGDSYLGPVSGVRMVAIAVPVLRDGQAVLLLLTTFETRQLQGLLDQVALPSGWSLSLLDGQGDQIAGRVSPGLDPVREVDDDGRRVVRSAVSPWSVVLEIPRQVQRAPMIGADLGLLAAILGTTIFGVLGGTLASRRLVEAVAGLVSPSPCHHSRLVITEIEQVRALLREGAAARGDAEAQLRVSEERLQLALDATDDGLWDWDLRRDVAYLTPRYYEMIGYRPDEVTPDLELFKRTVHPEDLSRVMAALEAHLRGETPACEFDYRLITGSGDVRWMRGRGRVVERDHDGAPLRMVGTISDIGMRKSAETALRRQTEELAQRNEELERFNRATVGRELVMIALKRQVNALSEQLGQAPPYPLTFLDAAPPPPSGAPS
ncbi:MAG: PAS domain-containing protein [Rhodospirillaceae bacterium]